MWTAVCGTSIVCHLVWSGASAIIFDNRIHILVIASLISIFICDLSAFFCSTFIAQSFTYGVRHSVVPICINSWPIHHRNLISPAAAQFLNLKCCPIFTLWLCFQFSSHLFVTRTLFGHISTRPPHLNLHLIFGIRNNALNYSEGACQHCRYKILGQKDENLIIPLNDSISGTLSMDDLCATTSVAVSDSFTCNRMWLNGEEVQIEANKRLTRCLRLMKELASSTSWPDGQSVHICSRNNFPTAAGLASSAAGYACLVYSLCKLFSIHDIERISTLARLGSGSACRSVYGGFVQWIAGHSMETSIARQIIDESAWPEIRVLVLVVSDHKKDTSSTSGMQLSASTSALMKSRITEIVPERIRLMKDAIINRDFDQFAQLTMQDSNQFHAICQDTYPPIRYMNDISWSVVAFIHQYNRHYGKNVAAYTFDAGPNACLYCLVDYVPELIALIRIMYSSGEQQSPLEVKGIDYGLPLDPARQIDPALVQYARDGAHRGALKYVISTKLGSGPQIIATEIAGQHSLLDATGLPK